MSTKTSKGGRPRIDSERVDTRIPREILDAIDAAAANEDDKPARPEMVRRLLREALEKLGYLKP